MGCSPAMSGGREGPRWVEDEGARTHPQVGARDGVWGDWLPLLRAFLLEADEVACDWSGPCVEWGLPLQHQGGGPHLQCLHVIRGTCGRRGRRGIRQPGGQDFQW